jgi:acetyl-CoA carboxylase biotin carboxyl carrier protein
VTLTAKDVAEITKLLEESSFDELYLELDGVKLSLRRGGTAGEPRPAGSARSSMPADPAVATTPGSVRGSTPPAGVAVPASASAVDAYDIPAPLLGTFYRAPKPGASAFVEVGAQVEEETIIGIIEVMKLMNTVRAGVRGRVTEILACDGALVEYGETLLRVSKTS